MRPSFPSTPTPQKQASIPQPDTLQAVRERILNSTVIGAAIAGVAIFLLVVVRTWAETPWVYNIIYTLVVGWMIIVALRPRFKYMLRVISLVGMVYVLGATSFLQTGVTADGAVFMLEFIFFTAMLIGSRASFYALGAALATAVTIGILMSMHILVPPTPWASDSLSGWVNRAAVLLLLGIVTAISLASMLRGLQANLSKAVEIAGELKKDQVFLREHSEDLERRSVQIRTAAEISRTISGVLDPQILMQQVVDLIKERFNLYYAGVFTVDAEQRTAILRAGTGAPGQEMIRIGYKLPIGESSMIGWTLLNRTARIALDVGQDAVRFANPYLPDTHSELSLPLTSGERILGALTIQSELPSAFDQDDITVLQNIADTLAIALENARLFAEQETNLDEIRRLHGQYLKSAWTQRIVGANRAEYTTPAEQQPQEEMTAIEVPLTLRDQIIGQLTLEGALDWSADEKALVASVATQAAYALENARLLEESQQTALRERLVAEITGKIWSSPNTDAILQTAIKELGRALGADEATIELKLD